MEANAKVLMAVYTHTHTNWNSLTNRLEISGLNLACDKIWVNKIRLSRHTKSM